MLADWFGRTGLSSADAANVLGCPVVTFRGWLAGRSEPDYFTRCAVERQMREGHDPLSDARMSPVEFTDALKLWRAKHGFTQREAAAAIGTSAETIRGWESQDGVPRQPALGEILRRLRMPVDVELVKQSTKRPRPIEPEKFAELMRAWRRRCKLSRVGAAYALRSVTALKTTDRTIWLWESARALPRRPLAVLEIIHGPLAVNPPKPPKPRPPITPRQFATLLRDWRRTHCLTQLQACLALGLPRDQAIISNWEKCKAIPKTQRLQQIVAALRYPPGSGRGTHNWFAGHAMGFGKKLRAWRKARRLTQPAASVLLGLHGASSVSHYERGKTSPRGARLARLLAIIAGTEVQP